MSWAERAFAPIEAHNREIVYQATWGHLAPRKHKAYRGHVIFAFGCFGSDYLNPTILACEIGLDGSPWLFDALTEFCEQFGGDEDGGLYRWDGTFKNYEFKGTIQRIPLTSLSSQERGK